MTTVTILMPESLKVFVEEQAKTKGYGTVSEYLGELVREAQVREADAKLENLLLEGLSSGEDVEVTPEFWKDLKAEAILRLEQRAPK
jgi:antitoxin ParD1/3/4